MDETNTTQSSALESSWPDADDALTFLRRLLYENVQIAGDVVELGTTTWAIHGVIPVDGSVLIAEFGSYLEARTALDAIAVEPSTWR